MVFHQGRDGGGVVLYGFKKRSCSLVWIGPGPDLMSVHKTFNSRRFVAVTRTIRHVAGVLGKARSGRHRDGVPKVRLIGASRTVRQRTGVFGGLYECPFSRSRRFPSGDLVCEYLEVDLG
ncbi:hypothetical protein GCM10027073_64300 [Streptomyces chlorus]